FGAMGQTRPAPGPVDRFKALLADPKKKPMVLAGGATALVIVIGLTVVALRRPAAPPPPPQAATLAELEAARANRPDPFAHVGDLHDYPTDDEFGEGTGEDESDTEDTEETSSAKDKKEPPTA